MSRKDKEKKMKSKSKSTETPSEAQNLSPFSSLLKPRQQSLEEQHISGLAVFVFIVLMLIAVGAAI
jgi:hypothetical protein